MGQTGEFLRRLRGAVLARDGGGLSDAELLDCFVGRQDEAAFEALLRRHGPMVLGVCRRLLGDAHDAEDAFQAAFLVLVRKAASIASRESLGGWLYGVAYRTALEARTRRSRRRARERQVEEMPQPPVEPDEAWRELRALLDHELNRLPEKYRVPVVVCDLEGKSRKEAARELQIPEGTLSSRLAQARKLLAKRLSRHGVALSGTALAAVLSPGAASACVPVPLLNSTARAGMLVAAGQTTVAGAVPARVAALTDGVMKAMLLTKLKAMTWTVVLVVLLGAGAAGLTYRAGATEPRPGGAPVAAQRALIAAPDDLEALRLEIEALRKEMRAMRERLKALEARAGGPKVPTDKGTVDDGALKALDGKRLRDHALEVEKAKLLDAARLKLAEEALRRAEAQDPLAQVEAAMKKLRQNPNDKQAMEALERALQRLKERAKPRAPEDRQPRR